MSLSLDPGQLIARIIAILLAISIHEWAHAFVATRLGDPTPKHEGRLTINPLAHLDPIGALLFLLVGFGWAKPVPVNPSYFRNYKRDTALVAAAGPVSNLLLATLAVILLLVLQRGNAEALSDLFVTPTGSPARIIFESILKSSVLMNIGLMAFNLLPIAPLDGSKVLELFVPWRLQDRYRDFLRIGPYLLLFLILFESFLPFPLLSAWVITIVDGVLSLFGWFIRLL